jgi:cobyrinic acid a,c-diamide synthase
MANHLHVHLDRQQALVLVGRHLGPLLGEYSNLPDHRVVQQLHVTDQSHDADPILRFGLDQRPKPGHLRPQQAAAHGKPRIASIDDSPNQIGLDTH